MKPLGTLTIAAAAMTAMQAYGQIQGQLQETRHQQIYIDREKTASPAIKQLLLSQRQLISSKKLSFTVGHTFALDHKLSDITGGQRITDPSIIAKQNAFSTKVMALNKQSYGEALKVNPNLYKQIPIYLYAPKATDHSLDWRKHNMVTPVRQQIGGTCWAYAAVAALESSSKLVNNQTIDASERYVVTNDFADWYVPGNWSGGGWCYKAIQFLVEQGTVTEASDPDTGVPEAPNLGAFKPYGGLTWGFCHNSTGQASNSEIKQALCEHGPVGTWIDAGGTFGSYTGNVYNDSSTDHGVGGHFVLIIGWDDSKSAWLIKNSWGTTWGDPCGYGSERGYAWVGYGIHGIGSDAVWIHDHPTHYQINKALLDKLRLENKMTISRVRH